MFDIGFPELVVISIVALLVIGPNRLPEAIRTLSLWIGRMQRSFANLRREFESEIGADEIRRQLHNEQVMSDLKNAQSSVKSVASEIQNTIDTAASEVKAVQKEVAQKESIQDKSAQDKSVQDKAVQDKAVQDEAVQKKPVQKKPSEKTSPKKQASGSKPQEAKKKKRTAANP